MKLTDMDMELLDMTTVPIEALQILKDILNEPIYQYFGYSDEELDYVPKDGVCVDLGRDNYTGKEIKNIITKLNNEYQKNNIQALAFASVYFIGLSEGNDCIAVIPGTDDLNIVRSAGTEGFNEGITNSQIIDKLILWKKVLSCDYRVIYADMQQIDAEFLRKPKNLKKLALRIKYFSPEVIERLEGGMDEMVRIMDSDNIFTLFWD